MNETPNTNQSWRSEMKRLIDAWRRHPILTTGFIIAVLFSVMFAIRSVVFVVYWSDPDHRNVALESWMTPRYIARSWDIPPEVVLSALGTDEMPGRRLSLEDIARNLGISEEELEKRIHDAAIAYRAGQE